MNRDELRSVVYRVVMRMMVVGHLHVLAHHDIVEAVKLEAPGVNGRRIWMSLTFIIYTLKGRCRHRLLWRNRFSLVGVHGKGSKRVLEYRPEVCDGCKDRLECLVDPISNESPL